MIINQIAAGGGGSFDVYDVADSTGAKNSTEEFVFSGLGLTKPPKFINAMFGAYAKIATDNGGSSGPQNFLLNYDGETAEVFTVSLSGATRTITNQGSFTFEVRDGNLYVNLSDDTVTITFTGTSASAYKALVGLIVC